MTSNLTYVLKLFPLLPSLARVKKRKDVQAKRCSTERESPYLCFPVKSKETSPQEMDSRGRADLLKKIRWMSTLLEPMV